MSAAGQKWTGFGSILDNTSCTTEDAMSRMTRGPAAEKSTGESNVLMPSDFPEDVKPPPQSVVDVEHSQYKAAWRDDMITELDGHKLTATYEAATPSRRRNPVGAKWLFSYKADKDGDLLPSVGQVACRAALRCLMQKRSGSVYGGSIIFRLFRANWIMCARFEDYQAATALAENPPSSARSKHIDVQFHFVRELLRAKKKYLIRSFGRAARGHIDEIPCCDPF